ncbi:hypothetical protein JCM16303_002142 [Sporobolomyces ruberrimus]
MEFARIVKKNEITPDEQRLVRRQGLGDSITSALGGGGSSTTTTPADSTSTTSEETTSTTSTTAPAESSASSASSAASSSAQQASSSAAASSSSAAESSSSTRDRTASSAAPSETTVTSVITPTTVIVIGTSSITSTLPPVTSTGARPVSSGNSSASSGSQLSTGAKVGIAVGSAVGGLAVLALLAFVCLGVRRRKRDKQNAADNILWPAVGDSSTLYPEQVHNTGGAGFGVGDDDDLEGPGGGGVGSGNHEMSEAAMMGAGAAGVGAAGAGASRFNRQPTLPQVPPSVYSSEQTGYPYSSEGGGGGYLAPSVPDSSTGYQSAYTNSNGYSAPGSQHSHAGLMAGAAGAGGALAGAGGLAYNHSQNRHTPSPPQDYSNAGHSTEEGSQLPFPGEPEPDFAAMGAGARPVSPTPMQVGDTFGQGYDETDNGRRWRLSVVNDDPRDRD